MPLIETKGAASAQGFGEFATSAEKLYIESCFSTYLYTGNGSTQTITNNIDLSTKGGLVWAKCRSNTADHVLYDTARGGNYYLVSNQSYDQTNGSGTNTTVSFDATGFTAAADSGGPLNVSGRTYASWTFRKQEKFFDVVTYTGTGSSLTVSHSLGATPGFLVIKKTSGTGNWAVFARDGTSSSKFTYSYFNSAAGLNLTAAAGATGVAAENLGYITSTSFNPNSLSGSGAVGNADNINDNGATYVAYLFAHDAGGFGLSGTDNVISCGSFTTSGSGTASVSLGYEPQLVIYKKSSSGAEDWYMFDNMRGMPVGSADAQLNPNLSNAEASSFNYINPTATGFDVLNQSNSADYIYIAIRRGPMKVPTSGTSVFAPVYATNPSSPYTVTTNFPVDLVISTGNGTSKDVSDRLRGGTTDFYNYLVTQATDAEVSGTGNGIGLQSNTSVVDNSYWSGAGLNPIYWNFRRAPGFFDAVCYTGDGNDGRTITHNLGVAPSLIIIKNRNLTTQGWFVIPKNGASYSSDYSGRLLFNATDSTNFATNYVSGSSSVITIVNSVTNTNGSGNTYVAYLFGNCTGVSKSSYYTGTGTTLQIDCGFTGGARFVLIKASDASGDWYVYDTARGIVSGNDPYYLLNGTAAEVTTTDYIDTYSAGFELSSASGNPLNTNGTSYIFLAIA